MIMGSGLRSFLIFLWFCFRTQVSNSQNLTCNPNDLRALEGFNRGLVSGIDGWGNASSDDCCNWVGVYCENSSRVTKLNLGDKKLRGVVSNLLAGLDQLKFLNLSVNSLTGELPSELFRLKNLTVLDLSHNRFNGSIPKDADLPSISVFNVSFNSISGSHPTLFGSVNLSHFDISCNEFSGLINTSICRIWSQVQVLQFSANSFSGEFPVGFGTCRSLRELAINWNHLSGTLPDDLFSISSLKNLYLQGNTISGPLNEKIGNLSSLIHLDISVNRFNESIPDVFGQLGRLQHISAHSNFFSGPLPSSLLNSPSLHALDLRNNSLNGNILDHLNCTAMANLSSLDLGSNRFQGKITDGLSNCTKLRRLNLARNRFNGQIPVSFQNLISLSYLSLTNNSFENIGETLRILQHCPKLTSLVLTINFHNEEMPVDGISGFRAIQVLIVPYCGLTGSIPLWLERCRNLQLLDLSWNHLNGSIPPWLGNLDSLFYLDLSNNSLTGEIPRNLTQLKGLISRNNSFLESSFDFPFFSSRSNQSGRGLQYNQVTSFPPTLDLCYNKLTGPIWPEFGNLGNLHVFDLGFNNLSGTIPEELSGMRSLELLDFSSNNLSGTIPSSLTSLTFLSSFNVAHNHLNGMIPVGGQFLTFPNSSFEGNLNLCGPHFSTICSPPSPKPSLRKQKNKGVIVGMAIGIGLGTVLLLAIVFYLVSRILGRKRQEDDEKEETSKHLEPLGSSLVMFQNKDNKELTIEDLLTSTNNFDQANIIGCGGFGLVYKATLPDGRKVAIKRLSGGDGCQMEREFQAEVETLSRAQHENLVRLQGYCRYGNDRLLIYSYMENGSLDYWLHEKFDGCSSLDWETRLEIAQGAARGLAYLHQSCQPHILHRDIKSSNILLDENFRAHLADFGLARLILPYDTHVTTDLVGTLGYIPPEYCQASVATFKGDVYSFGVVLLELLTGKRPMDVCKPRGCRDMISWVLQMKKEKREAEVFDPFIYDKQHDKQMLQVLEIACLCLSECPRARPLIQQIVSCLDNIGLN